MPHDPSHAGTERAFHAALGGTTPPPGLAAPYADPGELAARFGVYRNNIRHSLTRALAARFAVVEALVGGAFFAAMARVFIAGEPPRSPVLLDWGDGFAAFLDRFPPVAHLPYLGDVARIEHARGRACHAADADPVSPGALSLPDPGALRLVLHPSVSLLVSPMPAVQIWLAHQPGATRGKALAPGPDHALIARAPDFTVIVAAVDQGTHGVLRALRDGETLARAAALADPTPALTLLLRHGLIISIDRGTPA